MGFSAYFCLLIPYFLPMYLVPYQYHYVQFNIKIEDRNVSLRLRVPKSLFTALTTMFWIMPRTPIPIRNQIYSFNLETVTSKQV